MSHSDDEGFDEYQDHFPFLSTASKSVDPTNPQKNKLESSALASPLFALNECFPQDLFFCRTNSRSFFQSSTIQSDKSHQTYHDQDSVLHYFIATNESEILFDKYVQGIISVFMEEPGPIHAGPVPDSENNQTPLSSPSSSKNQNPETSLEKYLRWLKHNVVDKATRTFSSHMIGHMTSALPYFHRPLAKLLVALNQNVVKLETASTLTRLERQTIGMLHQCFYEMDESFYGRYGQSGSNCLGIVTSGGTIANITAMWMARNVALRPDPSRQCAGVAMEGFYSAMIKYEYKGAVIIGSTLLHYSFKKAADVLGLGEAGLCLVPVNDAFQIRIDLLRQEIDRCKREQILIIAVVGIAGTTEAGSVDPLHDMANLCQTENIHFHVDAAWGGPLIFSQDHRHKLHGINEADTITVDGHKQFYTPMGLGLLLTKSPVLAHSIQKTANYVIRADSVDMGKFTMEGSRPANIVYLHASLHLLGKKGLGTLLTRSCTLVRQMASRLQNHPTGAFHVIHEPMSNLLLYRFLPPRLRNPGTLDHETQTFADTDEFEISEYTRQIQSYQSSSSDPSVGFVSRTCVIYNSKLVDVFRVVIANPLTCWNDIETVLTTQLWIGRQVQTAVEKRCRDERIRHFSAQTGLASPFLWVNWPSDV